MTDARARWKKAYRARRVLLRESAKMANDMILFGTGGMVIYHDERDPEHVPIERTVLRPDGGFSFNEPANG